MMAGVHPFVAQEILGHKSIEMTRRYSHVSKELKKQAIAALRWDKLVQFPVKREKSVEPEST